ncbi:hypothetical protein MUO71_07410 [Candidatus Bathyarchaeota archaeon]|nr:hypothetical protein [Candidatus Bathyarchaeota archaeon]
MERLNARTEFTPNVHVFAHMRTAILGSVSIFPFWWIKEKRESYRYTWCVV